MKTAEELAWELYPDKEHYSEEGQFSRHLISEHNNLAKLLRQACIAGYHAANEWIPVSERLPTKDDTDEQERNSKVIALDYSIGICLIGWEQVNSTFNSHWQPLPNKPINK